VLVTTSTMAMRLSLMRNTLGNKEFPDITINGGFLEGIPVITSENIAAPTGSPFDGTLIVAINANEVMLADEGRHRDRRQPRSLAADGLGAGQPGNRVDHRGQPLAAQHGRLQGRALHQLEEAPQPSGPVHQRRELQVSAEPERPGSGASLPGPFSWRRRWSRSPPRGTPLRQARTARRGDRRHREGREDLVGREARDAGRPSGRPPAPCWRPGSAPIEKGGRAGSAAAPSDVQPPRHGGGSRLARLVRRSRRDRRVGAVAKGQDLGRLKGRAKVVAIKESVDLCPWADMVYGCDPAWWRHRQGLPKFTGLKVAWSGAQVDFPTSCASRSRRTAPATPTA
jgi:hypothetical protein